MSKGLIIGLGILGLLVAGAVGLFMYANTVYNQGVQYENELNALYQDNQNVYSTFKTKVYEALGIANLKMDKLDQVIKDAVEGRYKDKDMKPGTGGALFSSIKEAYPDVGNNTAIYDKIVDILNEGRTEFKNSQTRLLDRIRAYNVWRESGLIRSMITESKFPSNHLEARIGKKSVYGKEALDQMKTIVTSSDTQKSFDTGTDEPINFNDKK